MTTTAVENGVADCQNDHNDSTTPLLKDDDHVPSSMATNAISHNKIINNNIFDDDEELAMIGIREPPFRRYKRRTCTPIRCLTILVVLLTLLCLALILMLVFYDRAKPITDDQDIAHFYHLTDFHLDTSYNASSPSSTYCRYYSLTPDTPPPVAAKKAHYGRIGCDSPKALIDNALLATKVIPVTTQKHIDFIIASGDFVCHGLGGFSHDEVYHRVLQATTYTSTRLLQAYPAVPIFPAIGNNDVIGDYLIPYGSSHWYETVFSMWSALILCPICPDHLRPITPFDDIRQTFLKGGYYKVEIYGGKLAIISLNTLYWDTEVIKRSDIPHDVFFQAANQQLAWFRLQLEIASNNSQSVIIEGHVPPGVDTYLGSKKDYVRYWFDNYTAVYTHYVATLFPHVILGQFFAHMHKDDFRLLRDVNGMSSFMLLSPSISPVYSNNPSFRLLTLHKKEWKLLDYIQYYLDIDLATEYNQTDWLEGYRFSEQYPSKNKYINTERIEELSSNLVNPLKFKYWLNYAVARQVRYQFSAKLRFVYYCAIEFIQHKSFTRCLDAHNIE